MVVFDGIFIHFINFIEVGVAYIAMLRTVEDTTLVGQASYSSGTDSLVLETIIPIKT